MENKIWVDAGFGKRLVKKIKQPNGKMAVKSFWEEGSFDSDVIDLEKKTLLFFDGNGGTESKTANWGCKFIEGLIGPAKRNNYNLYSFYYGHIEGDQFGGFSPKERAKVFTTFIKPFLFDKNDNLLKEDQIDKNLKNLRLYAYCYGMVEINNILGVANKILTKHFSEEKSQQLLKNILIIQT